MALLDSLNWMDSSLCSHTSNIDFFPNLRDTEAVEKAKKVCKSCSVKEECLDYAIETYIEYGIFGGFTEDERRRLRPFRRLLKTQQNSISVSVPAFKLQVPNKFHLVL